MKNKAGNHRLFFGAVVVVLGVFVFGYWLQQRATMFEVQSRLLDRIAPFGDVFGGLDFSNLRSQVPKRYSRSLSKHAVQISTHGGGFIRFDRSTGELLHCVPSLQGMRSSSAREVPLSKSEFQDIVRGLLASGMFGDPDDEFVSLSLDENEVREGFSGTKIIKADGTFDVTSWEAYVHRTYKGYDAMSMVSIGANIRTGQIEVIRNLPFVAPASLEQNVSQEEALELVAKFAEDRNLSVGELDARQSIVHPNNTWSLFKVHPTKAYFVS